MYTLTRVLEGIKDEVLNRYNTELTYVVSEEDDNVKYTSSESTKNESILRLSLLTNHLEVHGVGKTIDFVMQQLAVIYDKEIKDITVIKKQVMPLIRPDIALKNYTNTLKERQVDDELLISPTQLEGLSLVYVLDSESSMVYITKRRTDEWGITKRELHEIAMNNLKQTKVEESITKSEQGEMRVISNKDGYDATRILTYDFDRLEKEMGSDLLISIPIRDMLVVTTNTSKQKIVQTMFANTMIARTNDYPISQDVFHCKDGNIIGQFKK